MDFTFSEQQLAISELAASLLASTCPPEALRSIEHDPPEGLAEAWAALGKADLLGLALPEAHGGSGLGLLDACLVAEQVGRHVAPVPYWPATAAAMTVAASGSDELRARTLPAAADGSAHLSPALWEPHAHGMVATPATRARRDADGWRLTGTKSPVPAAATAARLLIPAQTDDDVAVFAVEARSDGVSVVDEQIMSHEPYGTVHLNDVAVPHGARLDGGAAALTRLVETATALACATALGVAEAALALTAQHVTDREQFGSPIGTFQAVAHRCADAYIDTEAIRLTAWQAAWRLDAGLDASEALAIAAFWAADGGHRVVHAAQHLHGGIGVDIDYPVHRYFRWAKVLEFLLGGTSAALGRIGSTIAGPAPAHPRHDIR